MPPATATTVRRIGPLQELHLRQQMSQVFRVHALLAAAPAAALHPGTSGHGERRFGEHRGDGCQPWLVQRAHIGDDSRGGQRDVDFVGGEHFAGVRPQEIERRLHSRMGLFRTIAQTHDPVGAAFDVI